MRPREHGIRQPKRSLAFPMKRAFALLLSALFLLSVIPPLLPAQAATTPTITQTTHPSSFGLDVGAAQWSFSATKFSWASGSSNMTLLMPTMSVHVSATSCVVVQTAPSFSKNVTGYYWHMVDVSAGTCSAHTVVDVINLAVVNVTGSYNEKEIVVSGLTVVSGVSVSHYVIVNFPLTSSAALTACSTCFSTQTGNTVFDWAQLSAFTHSYSNSTKTLTVQSGAGSSTTTNFAFDPIALDGSQFSGCGSVTICNKFANMNPLTTTISPDVVVAFIYTEGHSAAYLSVSHINDQAGYSWTERGTGSRVITNGGTVYRSLYIYYAIATAALTADYLNVTLNAASPCSTCFLVTEFGVSGANTASPWDSHAGLPATCTSSACSVSTSNANDMIIGAEAGENYGAGTGFTIIQNSGDFFSTEYKVVSTTQSSLSIVWSGASYVVGMADAIVQAVSTVTQPIKISTLTSGAPAGTITISGGSPSPNSTFTADGYSKSYTLAASTMITLTASGVSGSTRYVWSGANLTLTFTSCSSGTCSSQTHNVYYQLKSTYEVTAQNPTTFDGTYPVKLSGTFIGSASSNINNNNLGGTGMAFIGDTTDTVCPYTVSSCWADYNIAVTFPATIGSSWFLQGNGSVVDTTGGHVHNFKYIQFATTTTTTTTTVGTPGPPPDDPVPYLAVGIMIGLFALGGVSILGMRKQRT